MMLGTPHLLLLLLVGVLIGVAIGPPLRNHFGPRTQPIASAVLAGVGVLIIALGSVL